MVRLLPRLCGGGSPAFRWLAARRSMRQHSRDCDQGFLRILRAVDGRYAGPGVEQRTSCHAHGGRLSLSGQSENVLIFRPDSKMLRFIAEYVNSDRFACTPTCFTHNVIEPVTEMWRRRNWVVRGGSPHISLRMTTSTLLLILSLHKGHQLSVQTSSVVLHSGTDLP